MKRIYKESKDGIVQITTADERWYVKDKVFVPSVTWICSFYPKGIAFYKWLANKGWDESQAIKQASADKGSKVHYAIGDLLDGKEVPMDAEYTNHSTGQDEELTLEEYECLMSFVTWYRDVKPTIIDRECVVFNEEHSYAGTVDLICEINGIPHIIDFKTGQYIWPEHELQISAYKHAFMEGLFEDGEDDMLGINLAILQLGFKRNKKGYKFTKFEDKFHLFLSAKEIWDNEVSQKEPPVKDYPEKLTIDE